MGTGFMDYRGSGTRVEWNELEVAKEDAHVAVP